MCNIKKIEENIHEIEKSGEMRVPGIVFASSSLLEKIKQDKTLEQIKNVAMLPGIVHASLAMPDAHMGYGFPIGGVAAFSLEDGVISPGGIGYDINCGVRLLKTPLTRSEFLKKREEIVHEMNTSIPSGVGRAGPIHLSEKELAHVLENGVEWAIEKGFATKEDLKRIESHGKIPGADASKVSKKALGRGRNQLGTMGAGNHFVEIQYVDEVFHKDAAKAFGLIKDQVVVLIHTGSRGLGHQVASDYILKMEQEYGHEKVPDRELVCAPLNSPLARDYVKAMNAAANFAFANRQVITHNIRKSFEKFFSNISIDIVYDVAHNIAKFEEFVVNGTKKTLCVHRKGATRAFGPNEKEIPKEYKKVGQPVFIPGSMGTASYVLVGTNESKEKSFSSTAHGAGRAMSRTHAKKTLSIKEVKHNLEKQNITLQVGSLKGISEEAPEAYKDIEEVARVVDELGISKKVARLKPLAVIKG